ncbi:MAG TPA: hypothetical protein VIU34_12805 [Steroidobacter sp.]
MYATPFAAGDSDELWRVERMISTYKSIWQEDQAGNYVRTQRGSYPLEFISHVIPQVGRLTGLRNLLGRKAQGVDYYRYYSDIILSGDRGKWANESGRVLAQLSSLGIETQGKKALDISGEPGFFGKDMSAICDITVTAFADNVAQAMADHHKIAAVKYDYQSDQLTSIFKNGFDVAFNRYSIGFCIDLDSHLQDLSGVMTNGGIFYLTFSPASRAVCARWMFDDYTYLRQYTEKHVVAAAAKAGFKLLGQFDEGSFRWDSDLHPIQQLLSKRYLSSRFFKHDEKEKWQRNVALVFRLG